MPGIHVKFYHISVAGLDGFNCYARGQLIHHHLPQLNNKTK